MDEFEDVVVGARLPMTPTAEGNGNARHRVAIAKLVSRLYRTADDRLRADMLTHLLRALGVLGLAAVASGAFARLVRRDGLLPDTTAAEDMLRYSSEQILELTRFVCEVNPDALQAFVEQLAQNGMGMVALSKAALVMLHRRLRGRLVLLAKSASGPDMNDGKRRPERT